MRHRYTQVKKCVRKKSEQQEKETSAVFAITSVPSSTLTRECSGAGLGADGVGVTRVSGTGVEFCQPETNFNSRRGETRQKRVRNKPSQAPVADLAKPVIQSHSACWAALTIHLLLATFSQGFGVPAHGSI